MICKRHKVIVYPINKNVPQTALRLGEILAIYEKTGALNAPVIEGGFEVTPNKDGSKDFPAESTPVFVSKLEIGRKTHESLFPNPRTSTTAENTSTPE